MIRSALLAASLLTAIPAFAFDPPARAGRDVRIPRMSQFLEWIPDGRRGLYIRADTGRWYYARLESECPRLAQRANIRFETAPNGDLDSNSAVRAAGWRCQIASISESAAPPQLD